MAEKPRYHYFSKEGKNYAYDRQTQLYYDRDSGFVYDPVTGELKDPNGPQPKKPSVGGQLASTGAGIAGTAGGYYVATHAPGWIGSATGTTAAPVAASAAPATAAGGASSAGGMAGLGATSAPAAPVIVNGTTAAATGAPAAPVIVNGTTAGTTTGGTAGATSGGTAAGASTGAGSGILGANGATLGATGVGLAGGAVAAYYAKAGSDAYRHLMSDDKEKRKRGAIETGLLATGPFLGWAAPFVSPIDEALGSGKDKDQQTRDWSRKNFERVGLTKNNQLTLADGSTFDVGLDGHARIKGADGTERRVFDVDFNDSRSSQTVADLDPLGAIYAAGDGKLRNDNTGYFTNAALSSGDTRQNVLKMYADSGFKDAPTVIGALDEMVKQGKLKKEERDILANSANGLFSGQPAPQPPPAPQPAGGMAGLGASQMQPIPQQPVPMGGRPPVYKPGPGGMASLGATGRPQRGQYV